MCWKSYRHWVGIAHGGSRIEVVVVREQLGGQGIFCIESFMGQGIPLSLPLMRGVTCNHGLRKVSGGSGVLNCPRLSQKSLEQSGLNWTVLGGSGCNWSLLRCPDASGYSFIEL